MNVYSAYWNRETCEVEAETSLQARDTATMEFQRHSRRRVSEYDVTVMLVEKDGEPVVHSTASL